MKEVLYYRSKEHALECLICPRACLIADGKKGYCLNKHHINGKLYATNYGKPCAVNIDPIEKKPLLHYKPQTYTLSLGTTGCNMRCKNCQNASISQPGFQAQNNYELLPEDVVKLCLSKKINTISFTYNEPAVFYEYMYDVAHYSKSYHISNVMVSNGFINPVPLKALLPYIDAANIDLKTVDATTHYKLTGVYPDAVKNTLKILKNAGVWIEITHLVIPEWTDKTESVKQLCDWLTRNGFSSYPLHFSRFHPTYKLSHLPITPLDVLEAARNIALKMGMKYVYIGNVPSHEASHTYCPACRKKVVERNSYNILHNHLRKACCPYCGFKVDGIWA